MEIFKGVIPCFTNEGVRVHGAAHEEFVCKVVDELTDWDYNTYVFIIQVCPHLCCFLRCDDYVEFM